MDKKLEAGFLYIVLKFIKVINVKHKISHVMRRRLLSAVLLCKLEETTF